MGSDPDKFDFNIGLNYPKERIVLLHLLHSLRSFSFVIKNVVNNTLHEAFSAREGKVEYYGPDSNAPKSQQTPNAAGPTFMSSDRELQNFTSEIRSRLAEAANSLDLFDKYVKLPSEETAKTLKLSFDHRKSACNELSTPDEIDEILVFIRTSLRKKIIPDSDNENKKSRDSDHETSNSVNKNYVFDSQLNSISEDASKIDLEKEKTSIRSPNFKNENNFQSSSENKQQQEKQQYNTVQSNDHEKFEDVLMQPSQELKRKHKQVPTSKAKKFVGSDQDPSIGQPLFDEKSKKVEMKIYPEVSSIDKEIDALKSLKCQQQENLRALKINYIILQKQLESLKIENREILAELGQISVEQTAKENEERKSELLQRLFRSSSPEAKRSVVSTSNDTQIIDRRGYPNYHQTGYLKFCNVNGNASTWNGFPNGLPKPQTTNEDADPPSVVSTTASSEQPVQGAEALLQGGNHQPRKEETVTRDKDESKIQGGDQNSTGISTYRNNSENHASEKTSGGEGIDQSGHVKGTSVLASTSRDESNEQSSTRQSFEDLSFSVQQDDSNGREYISLGNVPPTSVATTLYNNYKLLLLSLGQMFLFSDVVKLKDWATQVFSIENAQNATDVLLQLDQKRIINASDLSPLRDFFESIVRIDLVCIIDAFLLGDYSLLRQIPALKTRDANRAQNPQYGSTSRYPSLFNTVSSSPSFPQGSRTAGRNVAASGSSQMSTNRNPATSRKPEYSNGPQSSVPQQNHQPAFPSFLPYPNTNNPKLVSRSPNENQSTAHEQRNVKPIATGFTETSVVVADGPVTNERRTTASNSSTRTNPPVKNNARITVGSNGSKHSKFQPPDTERNIVSFAHAPNPSRNQDLELESNWLCSHYKRLCYVKFECCDNFWPCHRCHNNQSTCGRKKLKSRDTQMVKCVYCNKVQQFGQFCCDCGANFANYFCGLCQHLTGNDDHPYHCEKCGICRIHGDRSFHCDICGVCLDVQLRGNHKCREGSAHDECCICLEDAFTGCQILPCSHKVHKECATQMIRSGITRCPICRESFAHKLERRPLPNSRKRSGK